jgi:hypothetical protein
LGRKEQGRERRGEVEGRLRGRAQRKRRGAHMGAGG